MSDITNQTETIKRMTRDVVNDIRIAEYERVRDECKELGCTYKGPGRTLDTDSAFHVIQSPEGEVMTLNYGISVASVLEDSRIMHTPKVPLIQIGPSEGYAKTYDPTPTNNPSWLMKLVRYWTK